MVVPRPRPISLTVSITPAFISISFPNSISSHLDESFVLDTEAILGRASP